MSCMAVESITCLWVRPAQQPAGLAVRAELRRKDEVTLCQLHLELKANSGLAQHLQGGILASHCSSPRSGSQPSPPDKQMWA